MDLLIGTSIYPPFCILTAKQVINMQRIFRRNDVPGVKKALYYLIITVYNAKHEDKEVASCLYTYHREKVRIT